MKVYKTINKIPEVNVYPITKMNLPIIGNKLFITSSVNNNIYILTDTGYFYVMKRGSEKDLQQYTLTIQPRNKDDYQANEEHSQIWCDKLGNHVIIKFKNEVFYYNPSLEGEKVRGLMLINEKKFLQPYSVAFNDEIQERFDTGDILFSDYESNIYKLKITVEENKKVFQDFKKIFSFSGFNKNEESDDDFKFSYFNLSKNERILDMKLIISCPNSNMYGSATDMSGKNIFILAVTNKTLFQFVGKNSFEEVFSNYSLENGDILKAFKRFPTSASSLKFTRLQLISEFLLSSLKSKKNEKPGVLFGWMADCGYCMGRLGNLSEPVQQKNFKIFKYIVPKKDGTRDENSMPRMVCQSINHLFFLYKDCLVVENKLTNSIIHVEYFEDLFLDMYYNEIQNGIILYTSNDIYKIPLEQEHRYLWEDYIEIGEYELALKSITNVDKSQKIKIHKLYADYLFEKEQYLLAAKEYAYSDETFEQVCLKFFMANKIEGLICYLEIINILRIKNKNIDGKERDEYFIQRYLAITWLLELYIDFKQNAEKGKLIPLIKNFIRDNKYGGDYIDTTCLYFTLNIFGKNDELLEFAAVRQDYRTNILNLISHHRFKNAIGNLELYVSFNIETLIQKLTNTFYKYASLFMKESPKETIKLLDNYFNQQKSPEEIIRILTCTDIKRIVTDQEYFDQNYDVIMDYLRKLIHRPIRVGKEFIDFTKNQNLHNLYLLFLSKSPKENHKSELINYLKGPLRTYSLKNLENSNYHSIYVDLYFAKKILKDNPEALALVCSQLGQYNESLNIALENNLKETAFFIAKNLKESNLKKKIWLKIFDKYKTDNFMESKKIVEESKGDIKIEDILPKMGENVKINEFKDNLHDCIESYEKSVRKLNDEITEFNKMSKLINDDIYNAKKRTINYSFTKIRCHSCGRNIRVQKFFIFPCGHIFDIECLINLYVEYDKKNFGNDVFKNKVREINKLVDKIKNLNEKRQRALESQKNKENEGVSRLQKFKTLLQKDNVREEFTEVDNTSVDKLTYLLYGFLEEECLLCGDEMINSIQMKFCEDKNNDWEIL